MSSSTILWRFMKKKSKIIPQYIWIYSVDLTIYEQNYQRNAGVLPNQYYWQLQLILIVLKTWQHIRPTLALAPPFETSQKLSRHQPQECQYLNWEEVLQWVIRRRTELGVEKVRSNLWCIHSKDHPVGELSVRIHRWSDADGDGRQSDRKFKWRSAHVHPWEQSRIDAWEVAHWVGVRNDQLYFWVYWSLTFPQRKNNRRLICVVFRRIRWVAWQ